MSSVQTPIVTSWLLICGLEATRIATAFRVLLADTSPCISGAIDGLTTTMKDLTQLISATTLAVKKLFCKIALKELDSVEIVATQA